MPIHLWVISNAHIQLGILQAENLIPKMLVKLYPIFDRGLWNPCNFTTFTTKTQATLASVYGCRISQK